MLERLTGWLAGEQAEHLVPAHFGFAVPVPVWVCFAALFLVMAGIAAWYWRHLAGLTLPARLTMVTLRTAIITLALFLALGPAVVARYFTPGEQFVVMLFDDSQSMRIGAQEGRSRAENLVESYSAVADRLETELKRRHQLARYKVGATIEPVQNTSKLTFDERESDLIGAIAHAEGDFQGTKISAIVLFSDGVQQSSRSGDLELPSSDGPPVFTVGVDTPALWSDIEVTRLAIKRTDFDKSPVVATVETQAQNLAGHRATVGVYIGNRAIKSRTVEIDRAEETHEVRLEFVPDRKGWIEYEARVTLEQAADTRAPDEATAPDPDRIKENNARRFLVDNREKTYKLLYVSGRPNWENKFLRRAMEGDNQLHLSSLIAISNAEPKFEFRKTGRNASLTNPLFDGFEDERDKPRYDEAVFIRIGTEPDELASGYPAAAGDLFKYDLVILGDVGREFFSADQLQLTRDFVEKRGGPLLVLGGRDGFTRDSLAGTLLEPVLPVVLYDEFTDASEVRLEERFRVEPTLEGALAGAWAFSSDVEENRELWQDMPPLYGLNRFPVIRAGATIMAESREEDERLDNMPLFAVQRYGEGRAALLAVGDTWQWQMHLDEDDDRHERIWRQIARNLVKDNLNPVALREKKDSYPQESPARFEFLIRDKEYNLRDGLQTGVTLRAPSGESELLAVDESIEELGLYAVEYTPEQPGVHYLALTAINEKDEIVEEFEEAFLVEQDRREFQQAQYNPQFLKDIAAGTGGQFFNLSELSSLADAIPLPRDMATEEVLLHIWRMPVFYFALAALMVAEWYMRRKRGRA